MEHSLERPIEEFDRERLNGQPKMAKRKEEKEKEKAIHSFDPRSSECVPIHPISVIVLYDVADRAVYRLEVEAA